MDRLRRLFNSIDALFDRSALTERVQLTRQADPGNVPITASRAFALCKPIAMGIDRTACLMLIVAPDGGIRPDGTSPRWEFFFDLPRRRAQMIAEWKLPWSEDTDGYGPARIDVVVNPFPPPDSVHWRLVREGKLLRRQLIGMWQREHRRKSPLPGRLQRDTDAVMTEFARQGLNLTQTEVTLTAECRDGAGPQWIAAARNVSYQTGFA